MKPVGLSTSFGAVFTRQMGACLVAAAGFAAIGSAAALSLNAVAPVQVDAPQPAVTKTVLIKAPVPILMPAQTPERPEPIIAPLPQPAPSPAQATTPEPQPVTVIAVTPTISPKTNLSCVTDLAAFVQGKALHFPLGGAELTEDEKDVLQRIGEQAENCPEALVQIEGHTDSIGPDALNLKLSWRRAENTLAALDALGIDTEQFEPVGYGARAPMAEGDASEDHLNRRVEFKVLKQPVSVK
ncbi:MAG: OmpA family protein [Litoreibacter sp.]|nr:OmpA family protein [Litoreibacter sp.]